MTRRIRIAPGQVRAAAAQFRQASDQSGELVKRLTATVLSLESEWDGVTRESFYGNFQEWQGQMNRYVTLLAEIDASLKAIAERFETADAQGVPAPGGESLTRWSAIAGPLGAAVSLSGLRQQFPHLYGETTPAAPPVAPAAPTAPTAPMPPVAGTVEQLLYRYFSKEEDCLILRHTIAQEGPGKFGANWGGVVYVSSQTGQLQCDRQWINFGLISFAYPSGAAGGVLRSLLGQPEEEAAFREIALRVVKDNPGGSVPDGWSHLLENPADTSIPALSKEEQVDQFVARIKAGDDVAARDWVFKYLNEPATRSDIATGTMRADWNAALSEFLGRPASQVVQLSVAREQYLDAAVDHAERFGLTSVRGVGFMFDTTVQSGGPTAEMKALLDQQEYLTAPEGRKLELLLSRFAPGSTEYHRRKAVLESPVLTDEPYPFGR